MLNTTTYLKPGKTDWSSLEGAQSLRMSCPLCDTKRSGACNHKVNPNIPNLKGNSK